MTNNAHLNFSICKGPGVSIGMPVIITQSFDKFEDVLHPILSLKIRQLRYYCLSI